jgi:hypothetical protein
MTEKGNFLDRFRKSKVIESEIIRPEEVGFPPPPAQVSLESLERARVELKEKLLATNHSLTDAISAFRTIRSAEFESSRDKDYRQVEWDTLEAIHKALTEVIIENSKRNI